MEPTLSQMAYGFVGAGFPEHYDRIRPIVHPL
jgi:hypothetical protein